jgi:hypothetical protein
VHDEPEERDRQLHEKNDCREPAEGRHAGILVEGWLRDNIFLTPQASRLATEERDTELNRAAYWEGIDDFGISMDDSCSRFFYLGEVPDACSDVV